MPNTFAFVVIWTWPLVCYWIFKKQQLPYAVAFMVVSSYLILPEKTPISLPGLPPIAKNELIGLLVLLTMYWDGRRHLKLPETLLERRLIILIFASVIFMIATNRESLVYGPRFIPGLTLGAWFQQTLNLLGVIVAPFLAGYHYFKTEEHRTRFLQMLVCAGLLYSLPMIIESVLSPQINVWVYGFFPSSWAQQARFGGFRPVVFLGHGLYVAAFISLVFGAAIHLNKEKKLPIFKNNLLIVCYLGAIVVICKTVAAVLYGIIFIAGFYFLSRKKILLVTAILSLVVLTYPYIRTNLIPVDAINELTLKYNEDKHGSLKYRFDMEEIILEKSEVKKYFGWGASGRNFIYDTNSGKSISVPDGYWVITYSVMGWVGYLGIFGLMTCPMFKAYLFYRRKNSVEISTSIVCLSFLLVFNLVDLIPNSSMNCISSLMAGIIGGGIAHEKAKLVAKT